jgi:hypothetical protein
MQIPVQQFPILTPGQMNPYHQALQGGLEMYGQMNTAKYAPQLTQANIAAKNAYANNYHRQLLAQVLGNKDAVAGMKPEQLQALLTQFEQGGQNAGQALSGGNIQPKGILSQIASGLGFGGSTQNVPQGTLPPQPQGQSGSGYNSGYQYDAQGNNVRATEAEIDQAGTGQPNTPAQNAVRNAKLVNSKNPATGTFVNPEDNSNFSPATSSTESSVQTSLITSERVAPYVKDLANQYEKSFGLLNNVKAGIEGAVSYVTGGQNKTPHLSASSHYKTDLVNAADGFLKELNLNNTTGNRESMERALEHGAGESPANYRARINWLWNTIQQRDEVGKRILFKGIKLNPNATKSLQGLQNLDNTSRAEETIVKAQNKNSNDKFANKKVLTWNHEKGMLE